MAKQSSNKSKSLHKKMSKVIIPMRTGSNGAYAFKEEVILLDKLNETLAKYKK